MPDLKVQKENKSRIKNSCELAIKEGNGTILIIEEESSQSYFYSTKLMCPKSGISYPEPEPNTFSFNSPKGMCESCNGLGSEYEINIKQMMNNRENIIDVLVYFMSFTMEKFENILLFNFSINRK